MTSLRSSVAATLLLAAALAGQQPAAGRPNVVLIYADDLGYGDVSCYNPERGKIRTPHIDRLARSGLRFTDAHSSSGVCSPSRYTLLTGRYHWRTRLQSGIVGLWGKPLIAADRPTLGSLAGAHGYRTACIGKWHLGWDWPIAAGQRRLLRPGKAAPKVTAAHRAAWQAIFSQPIGGGPTTRGFDQYFGTDVPNWPPYCFIENDRTVGIPSTFLPPALLRNNQASQQGPALADWKLEPILPALAERAARFIRTAAEGDKPFLLYLPLTAPHTPLAVNEPFRGKTGLGMYADFVVETDAIVGRVLDAIAASGAADRTLVLFTSDNGCAPYIGAAALEKRGHHPSGPLRGYKSDAWEGGHRVPFLVRWPGVVTAGRTCDQLVHQADVFATLAEILGAPVGERAGEDSFSLLPLLRGGDRPIRSTAVSQSARGLLALRRGHWKLILGPGSGGWSKGRDPQPAQLYDLSKDLGEQHNLYAEHPQLVAELTGQLAELVRRGRSTPGRPAANDVPVRWRRFLEQRK